MAKKPNVEEVESPTSTPLASRSRRIDPDPGNQITDDGDPYETEETVKPPWRDEYHSDAEQILPPLKRRRVAPSLAQTQGLTESAAGAIIISSSPPSNVERSPSLLLDDEDPLLRSEAAIPDDRTSNNAKLTASRFRFQQQSLAAVNIPSDLALNPRRAFALGAPYDAARQESLAFKDLSPQKKNNRFMSGGLASLVRQWILGTSSEAPTRTSLRAENKLISASENSMISIKIADFHEDDMTGFLTVRAAQPSELGDRSDGEGCHENWLLIGKEGYGFEEKRLLHENDIVTISPPFWEVEIDGLTWAVAVNWAVRENKSL